MSMTGSAGVMLLMRRTNGKRCAQEYIAGLSIALCSMFISENKILAGMK